MKTVELSMRLQAVLDALPRNCVLADIGTDHAWLPIAAVQSAVALHVIGGEYNEGPYLTAKRNIASVGLEQQIEVRKGDGLHVLQPNEVNALSICGMGGALMRDILQAGFERGILVSLDCIVVQPNIGEELLRTWMREHGWCIKEENWIEEEGRIYPILSCVKDENSDLENPEMTHPVNDKIPDQLFVALNTPEWRDRLGIWNLNNPSSAWWKKWQLEHDKLEKISHQMNLSEDEQVKVRALLLKKDHQLLGEVLKWWQLQG